MKSLDKDDIKRRDGLVDALDAAYTKMQMAMAKFNDQLIENYAPVQDAIEAYNEAITDAAGFAQDVVSQIEDYTSDKSEKWQEGERAQAYAEWQTAWECLSLEEVDLEEPSPLDLWQDNSSDELRNAEVEVGL